MIKAILFDVDGTLLDTFEYIYQGFEYALRTHKLPAASRDELKHLMGQPLEACYQKITLREEVSHLMDTHKEYQRNNPLLSKVFPHTIQTLDALRSKGISIGAVTSRSRVSAIATLEVAQVFPLIDYFVGFEDVVTPKPDPEGINKALSFFDIKPHEAFMVGDSPVDIEAGRNAGTHTVGVTYGFHGGDIQKAKPDHILHDIKEVIGIIGS